MMTQLKPVPQEQKNKQTRFSRARAVFTVYFFETLCDIKIIEILQGILMQKEKSLRKFVMGLIMTTTLFHFRHGPLIILLIK